MHANSVLPGFAHLVVDCVRVGSSSGVDSPEVDSSEADSPGVDSPGVGNSEVDSPEVDSSGVDSPGVDSPGWVALMKIDSLGANSPVLLCSL